MRHFREKLQRTEAKLNTKYVLWRFDILQLHSAAVYLRSQGFVVSDYGMPQRTSEAAVNREDKWFWLERKKETVGGPNHGNQSCGNNSTQIS